jgi:hypothetical protein
MIRLASISVLSLGLLGSLVGGCASSTDDNHDDLLSNDDSAVGGDGKADGAVDGTYTYYALAASGPGYTLARLNRSTTTCFGGANHASCTVSTLDFSESGLVTIQDKLTSAAHVTGGVFAIARGRFASGGRFLVTEGWVAQGGAPADGVFARVLDNGIRCITAPCPSLVEKGLNESNTANIAAVDFTAGGFTDRQTDTLNEAMLTEDAGILVAGDRYTVHQSGHTAKGRTATNAYAKLVEPATASTCVVSGCSHEVCADEAMASPCIYRPVNACYQTATCEVQAATGHCGWTDTTALDACIAANP